MLAVFKKCLYVNVVRKQINYLSKKLHYDECSLRESLVSFPKIVSIWFLLNCCDVIINFLMFLCFARNGPHWFWIWAQSLLRYFPQHTNQALSFSFPARPSITFFSLKIKLSGYNLRRIWIINIDNLRQNPIHQPRHLEEKWL